MKKILVICPEISGNPFTRTLPFLQALKNDYEFVIVGPMKGKPYVWDKTVKAKFINAGSSLPKGLKLFHVILKIIKTGIKEDFDFIFGFKLQPHVIIPGIFLKKIKNIKFILDIDDLETELESSRFKKYLIKYCENKLNKVTKITASSRFLARKYNGLFIPSCADENWANKINKKLYNKLISKYNLKNKIVIGYIGAFRKHKGVALLIKAVQKAKEHVKNLSLILVGKGPKNIENDLKNLAKDETLFLGFVEHEKLPTYFKIINIFVIPNLHSEVSKAQTPAKLFEAMAANKAIIATNTSGMQDILGNAGVIVKPSVEEISNAITKLAKNKILIKSFEKKVKNLYAKKYNFQIFKKKVISIF